MGNKTHLNSNPTPSYVEAIRYDKSKKCYIVKDRNDTAYKVGFVFKMALGTLLGALAGGTAGFFICGPAGVVLGAMLGGAAGYTCALAIISKTENLKQS